MNSFPVQKRLMVAAPASGSGKTVVTLALLRTLANRGVKISPAKGGPDYIDPGFHEIAAGRPAVNLDPWAMSTSRLWQLAQGQGETLLIEAMMGLFDGAANGSGSAADLAAELKTPVLLVVDGAKLSHSIAALVSGFVNFRTDVKIAGVILNKIGSVRHEALLRNALEPLGLPVVGAIPRDARFAMPERHLGLVQAKENEFIDDFIEAASACLIRSCDLEALTSLFDSAGDPNNGVGHTIAPLGQNIAIARDVAFAFSYRHMLEDWRKQGAGLSFFSPLADEGPVPNADAIFLPGGYPELHCEQLTNAETFRRQVKEAASRGAVIYGECGGYMILGETIVDEGGKGHPMLGLLSLVTSFEKRRLHLGYRNISAQAQFPLGSVLRGHEFHYTSALKEEGRPLFSASDAFGNDLGSFGLIKENVMGSYLHVIDRGMEINNGT